MASFRIHEDVYNYIPSNKISNKISGKVATNPFQQKSNIIKESKIPVKRVPLRPSNFTNNSNPPIENKLTTQVPQKVEIYSDPSEVQENVANKPKQPIKIEAFKDVQIVPKVVNKENLEYTQESQETFYFPFDNFYVTTAEYHDHMYMYLINLERTLKRPKPDFMAKQPELTPKMRSILVDWLSAVSEEYKLQPQTLHLAVNYIDCFLSRMSVVKTKFQLVGTAAIMIAAKYEEIYPPETKEWAYLTADSFSPKQLLRMEQLILKVLQFDLAQPTAFSFIAHICFVCNLPKNVMLLALYFSELVMLEGEDYIKYLPSQLAFAAIALARHTLDEKDLWPRKLAAKTGYSLKQLSPIIKKQHKSFRDSPTRSQQAIQEKFKTPRFGRVSLFQPKSLDLTDLEE